jgi:hypothetical protein
MSASILCSGCGGRVTIPDGYSRGRIRCPECGVMSDVPAAAQRQAAGAEKPRRAAPSAEKDRAAEDILLGNDAPPPAEKKPAKRKSVQAIQKEQPRAPKPLHPLPPSPNLNASDDEDDGKPYRVPGIDDERPCPECCLTLPRDAVLCTRCGYNLQTGKKAKQEFEPVDREWQGGWPVNLRRGLFVGAVAFYLIACVIAIFGEDLPVFGAFFPALLFTAMTAFLLGTYERIHLTRNKKGRVRITKTWTICFIPRPPQDVDVHEYGGIVYGPYEETSILEWLILLLLLPGIVPAILWIYFVFIRTTFQVALSKEHGYPELVLYRGGDQQMVMDIAETVGDVAHLPKA